MTWRCMALIVALAGLAGCREAAGPGWQGYVEGDYLRVGAPEPGTLVEIEVAPGAAVARGAPLFALEREPEAAARREAEQRVAQAAARLADLEKGRRPDELAALAAQQAQAKAALGLARAHLARQERLVAAGFVSRAALDEARAAVEREAARVAELAAQLRVARLPARTDLIAAARAELATARAVLAQAQWRLGRKAVVAPAAGRIEDRLYLPGEYVPAGNPVLVLLPPENLKLRFYVPETALARFQPGGRVLATCDGCGAAIPATVSFIANEAAYTPPVLYSREGRAKLVYLVEARPAPRDAARLHVGQPVDVRLP